MKDIKEIVKILIFSSKWLLIPFLLKLFWTLSVLGFHFVVYSHVGTDEIMAVLEAVDVIMIATLVKMIITGSYHSFIDRNHGDVNENSSSGVLKIKLATSILGVTTVHLLQAFVNLGTLTKQSDIIAQTAIINLQLIVHVVFIVGCLGLAIVDYLYCKSKH